MKRNRIARNLPCCLRYVLQVSKMIADTSSIDWCAFNAFTGADLYGLCSAAYMGAVQRIISSEDKDSDQVPVKQEDFVAALKEFKPSLTKRQIAEYEQLKTKMK